jgi:hypothetical protein
VLGKSKDTELVGQGPGNNPLKKDHKLNLEILSKFPKFGLKVHPYLPFQFLSVHFENLNGLGMPSPYPWTSVTGHLS